MEFTSTRIELYNGTVQLQQLLPALDTFLLHNRTSLHFITIICFRVGSRAACDVTPSWNRNNPINSWYDYLRRSGVGVSADGGFRWHCARQNRTVWLHKLPLANGSYHLYVIALAAAGRRLRFQSSNMYLYQSLRLSEPFCAVCVVLCTTVVLS